MKCPYRLAPHAFPDNKYLPVLDIEMILMFSFGKMAKQKRCLYGCSEQSFSVSALVFTRVDSIPLCQIEGRSVLLKLCLISINENAIMEITTPV